MYIVLSPTVVLGLVELPPSYYSDRISLIANSIS